jgi:hypothetical protein
MRIALTLLSLSVCVRFCVSVRLQPVAVTQKKDLLAFLRGESSSAPDLDIAGLQRLEGDAAGSAAGGEGEGERAGKRQRVGAEEEAPLKPVAEWNEADIIREECALATHHSVLQVPKKVRMAKQGEGKDANSADGHRILSFHFRAAVACNSHFQLLR